jgi:hypothetical protein
MLRYGYHAQRRMASRHITEAEVEEAWAARQVTSRELARPPHTGEVLVIRSTLSSGRRLKVVVPARDERFVITLADQDEEAR